MRFGRMRLTKRAGSDSVTFAMLKLSVRRKIISVVVTLSLVILGFGAYMSLTTFQSASGRGQYLKARYERFHDEMDRTGVSDLAAAMFIATDPDLVRAMTRSTSQLSAACSTTSCRAARVAWSWPVPPARRQRSMN